MATKDKPAATISAINASLTLVLIDSGAIGAWEPLDDEGTGGHPEKVRAFYDDEDFVSSTLAVGNGKALVMTLEGLTGMADVRKLADGAIALVEPPREWWDDADNYGKKKADVAAMFADALGPAPKAGKSKVVGAVSVPSGKLVIFELNAELPPAAKVTKKTQLGDVKSFGDDRNGVVVGLTPGTHAVSRRVIEPKWAEDQALVVAILRPA